MVRSLPWPAAQGIGLSGPEAIIVHGAVPADERRGLYSRTLDNILEGWTERCTQQYGLQRTRTYWPKPAGETWT